MDSKIPAYTYPCLASSFYSNNPQLIFLFGVPDGTPTLVSHLIDISNIDTPKISYISSNSKADRQYKWDSKAEKSCFTNTMSFISGGFANTEVQQLGTTTFAAILYASFELQHMFDMSMVKFKTSKLFASTRVHGRDDYVVAWAVFTFADPVSGAPTVKEGWVGVFRNTSNIFVTGQRQPIDNGGATLTSEAIPISAQNIAFILDQTPKNLTVVYSLQPGSSPKLEKVTTKGDLPPFNKNMVGTVLDEYSGTSGKIVIYSLDQTTGAARFNLFDTITGIWTGPGLVDPSSEPATAPPLLSPRRNITNHATNNAAEISAGRDKPGAGRSEPSATATIENDVDSNKPPVFWVVTIGSVVVAFCLLSVIVFFVTFRQRRRVGANTFVMSSPLPPTGNHDPISSADSILARDRTKVPYSEPQPLVQPPNHQIIECNSGDQSLEVCHYCAHSDQQSAPSPLKSTTTSATMATTEARATTATAAATTSHIDSYKYAQPIVPVIFRPQASQLDLSLTSNHSNLSTPNTPPSSTLTTPDQLNFGSFCHLQHGRSRAKKRQTGSPFTTEEVILSPILPPDQVPAFSGLVATTTISSRSQPQVLTHNPSTTSLARGPHTVVAEDPAIQLAFKKSFEFQAMTTATTITPFNTHVCDPSSARPSLFP
ncbi:hypothetical protein BGZ89_003113 [Linnemannia elongata]|nr:hypothetical protein BGZ89_003113 [Linnemannia elongata]